MFEHGAEDRTGGEVGRDPSTTMSSLRWERNRFPQDERAPAAYETRLRLDGCFIDEHDGDVIFDDVDPVTLGALQGFRVLAVFESLLAGWADQHFQKFFGNHDFRILRQATG